MDIREKVMPLGSNQGVQAKASAAKRCRPKPFTFQYHYDDRAKRIHTLIFGF